MHFFKFNYLTLMIYSLMISFIFSLFFLAFYREEGIEFKKTSSSSAIGPKTKIIVAKTENEST